MTGRRFLDNAVETNGAAMPQSLQPMVQAQEAPQATIDSEGRGLGRPRRVIR